MEKIEIWKVIDGYNDYQISNFGNVKSTKYSRERILKGGISNSTGYKNVTLCKME